MKAFLDQVKDSLKVSTRSVWLFRKNYCLTKNYGKRDCGKWNTSGCLCAAFLIEKTYYQSCLHEFSQLTKSIYTYRRVTNSSITFYNKAITCLYRGVNISEGPQ